MQLAESLQSQTRASVQPVILVADDDPDVCTLMAAVLGEQTSVVAASDGSQALHQALVCRPSLIVCDSEMPGLRGHEVIRALAADPALAHIPVILTSGYPQVDVIHGCEPAAFLQKPFTLTDLICVVQEVLSPPERPSA